MYETARLVAFTDCIIDATYPTPSMSRDAYATYHNQSYLTSYVQCQQSYHERDYARSSYSSSRYNRDYSSDDGLLADQQHRFEPYILRALRESRQTADVIRTIAEVKARHVAISSVHTAATSATTIVSTANSVAESPGQVTASLAGRISSSFTYLRGTSPWASNARVQTVDEAAIAVAIPLEENEWEAIELQQVEPELVLDPDLGEEEVEKTMETMYKALNEGVLVWEDVKDAMTFLRQILSILRERRAALTDTTTSQEEEPPFEGPPVEDSEQSGRPHEEESSQEVDTTPGVEAG